jgi:hypothetical protein
MKKLYTKPEILCEKEIEALAGTCGTNDGNTGGTEKGDMTDPQCQTNVFT